MTALLPADHADPATTVHPLLSARWSPRSFDPLAELDAQSAARLLEAARWAPSASNTQPWRFLLAHRGTDAHTALLGTLAPFNAVWAARASALLLIAARTTGDDGAPLRWASYDTGQAAANISAQAQADGWSTHQMGGFDSGAVHTAFALPAGITPLAVMAIGRRAAADRLPEALAARETAPRERRELAELLLPGSSHPPSMMSLHPADLHPAQKR